MTLDLPEDAHILYPNWGLILNFLSIIYSLLGNYVTKNGSLRNERTTAVPFIVILTNQPLVYLLPTIPP